MPSGELMNEHDTRLWRAERHPRLSSTLTALVVLDQAPDWSRLCSVHDRVTRLIPRCRQRVLEPALPVGPPAWVPDPGFDLAYHLRRTSLPSPGSLDQLLQFAQANAVAPLDRSRPLWEGLVIEGLAGGRAAYLLKLHQLLVDGLGGMRLLSSMWGRTRQLDGVSDHGVPRVAQQVWSLLSQVDSVPLPAVARPSPLLGNRSGGLWRFGVLDCDLAELVRAAASVGGSADDAYVAALLGGLRRYHEKFDAPVDTLPIAVGGVVGAAPIGVADPAARIASVRARVAPVRAWAPVGADLAAAKLSGQSYPVYLAGALVRRVYPFGPLPGVALMATMMSHVGTCCIGINYDGHAITDHEALMGCLVDGLDEVLALARED
jgi:diacylglycerol O-acyltransferase / wax synthase